MVSLFALFLMFLLAFYYYYIFLYRGVHGALEGFFFCTICLGSAVIPKYCIYACRIRVDMR